MAAMSRSRGGATLHGSPLFGAKIAKIGLVSFQTSPRTGCERGRFPAGFSYGVFSYMATLFIFC